MDGTVMARRPSKLTVDALVYAAGFVWATILALVAIGGAFPLAMVMAVAGGFVLAWVREHV